ncbi:MAG: tetratricopeptide repeat protein [Pseudomonadota bacterium]
MQSTKLAIAAAVSLLIAMQPATAGDYSALMKAKKYTEVERAAVAKLAQDPANADAMIARTEAILGSGNETRLEEAIKQAEQCVSAKAANAGCHLVLGKAMGMKAMTGGMLAAASSAGTIRDSFKKAVELDPKNVDARFSLLQFYMMAPGFMGGGTGKAEDLTAQTVPVNAEAAKLMQGSLDLAAGRFAKAEAAATGARAGADEELLDRQENLMIAIGAKYMGEKKFADAERVLRDAQKRFPDSESVPYISARVQQEQGKHREAVAGFEQVLVKTQKPYVHFRLGQSLQALGEKAKAMAAYEKALSFKTGLAKKMRSDAEDALKALKG